MPNYKIINISPYLRKGKRIKGYKRRHLISRGKFKNSKIDKIYKTFYLQDKYGRFEGRERVTGIGDKTSIIRESKGRIIGRTPKAS